MTSIDDVDKLSDITNTKLTLALFTMLWMVYIYLAAKARRTTPYGPKCSNTPHRKGCKAGGTMGYMPLCHRELGSSRKVAH